MPNKLSHRHPLNPACSRAYSIQGRVFTVLTALLCLLFAGPVAAQLVITEIMQNPSVVPDSSGEWFELYNPTGSSVDIDGWTIKDNDFDIHLINNGGPLLITAGGYLVLGNNPDSGTNGGVSVDYSYGSGFFLSNGIDELVLQNGSLTEIDRVEWDNGATFPDPNGASMSLLDPVLDNNTGSNWCTSTSAFGSGDLGTPGAVNNCTVAEAAPTIVSTTPPSGGTGVALDANITINFSEDVDVTGSWFDISCTSSGANSAVVTGGPQSYILNPDTPFVMSETCTVDIFAALVTDSDTDDPPDNMASDFQFSFATATPPVGSSMLINEIDSDQSGTDAAEFIELFDGGVGNTALDGLVVVLFNGSDNASYLAFDLDGQSTGANGYFVLCGNAANTALCDLDVSPNTNLIQNGADAAALFMADATDFPNDTPLTTNSLIDAIVYDTDDNDDVELLTLLNAGQPQVNERGGGDGNGHSNQRCPSGAGGGRNTDTYIQAPPTPGLINDCLLPIINEVDADTPGSDVLEFVELYDGGVGNLPLDGLVLVTFNGSDDQSYNDSYDLDGFTTDANGYFVIGNATVANVGLIIPGNSLQNGADAVALYIGNASNFPNDTPLTTISLIDAIVYDTDDSDDATLLTLLNPGQPQVNERDGGNGTGHSNQRCPNGFGGERNTSSYSQATPTPGAANDCTPLEIWEIQGAGEFSIFADVDVATADNIVTAVGPEGFTMQTPDARADGSSDTSNGIYVFTGSAPTVAAGDSVDVSGRVVEFFGFTEFSDSPSVSINSSGNPLPGIVNLGASIPSPDPLSPSCAIEYECYESMLVQISGGSINSGNQGFGSDPIAETYINATGTRSFRAPGTEYPLDLGGSIPVWDGNPEVFELDPDRLGLPNIIIPGGSGFDATGVIGFDFGGYELWPTSLVVTPAPSQVAVRARVNGETTIGSLNLFRFATAGDYATRLAKLSRYIREVLISPDILAVQEADSLSSLQDLADTIAIHDGSLNYTPHLIEGNDVGGIDVGFLLRDDIEVDALTQMGAAEIFTFDSSLLHDRPPLLLEGRYTGNGTEFPLAVLVVHNRSLNGIDTERVQLKRLAQAESIATMVQTYQAANLTTPLAVVGDFNAFEYTDGFVDAVGHIMGNFDPAESLRSGSDLVNPNLVNQVESLAAGDRYSFIFRGNAQTLDHALTSSAADSWVRGFEFGRGNADAAQDQINDPATAVRSSDHDGFVLFLMTDYDGDGVADDVDACKFNPRLSTADPEYGCAVPIPTLHPAGMLLLLLMLAGMGAFGLRYRPTVNR